MKRSWTLNWVSTICQTTSTVNLSTVKLPILSVLTYKLYSCLRCFDLRTSSFSVFIVSLCSLKQLLGGVQPFRLSCCISNDRRRCRLDSMWSYGSRLAPKLQPSRAACANVILRPSRAINHYYRSAPLVAATWTPMSHRARVLYLVNRRCGQDQFRVHLE